MRTVRFIVALCGLFGLLGFSAAAQLLRIADSNTSPLVALEGNTVNKSLSFSITVSPTSTQTVTVTVKTANGMAIAGQDYRALDTTISIPPNTILKTVTVTIFGDLLNEADETFFVNLSSPVNAAMADSQAVGTILNDDPLPSISILDVSKAEGNSGAQNFQFKVSLSAPSGQQVSVQYSTADGTATVVNNDYVGVPVSTPGTLIIPAGATSQDILITVNGDLIFEPNETFLVNLSSPSNATISDGQAIGTIQNDDPQPSISINNATITEGNSGTVGAVFTVTLSNPSSQPIGVDYSTSDGTATAGTDYVAGSGTLTFNPGETTKNITIDVNGDNLNEQDETFFVNLSNPANATLANAQGVGTILNDDPPPSISIDNTSVIEGNTGTINAMFNITLSAPSSKTISVDFTTTDGTATAGSDYAAGTGTLTFNPGETSKSVTVAVNGDMLNEADETFFVNLSNPVNATIANAQGLGTILNDDAPPSFSINDVTVTEGNVGTTNATFTVSLSNPSGQAITVDYSTADGTATAGSDYSASSGTLLFNPGETTKNVVVIVNGDNLFEADETFFVNLTNAANAAILDGLGAGTIINDDPDNHPPIAICKNVSVPATTECSAVASINDGSSDPDGDPIVLSQDPPGPYPLGTTLVTLTVSDGRGGTASCQSTVTVFDNMPPMIAAPADINTFTGPDATTCGIIVNDATLGTATVTDNCPGVTITRTGVPTGNLFPVGTTIVTYSATDASGNTASANQQVIVRDNTAPVIACPANITASAATGQTSAIVDFPSPTATDNCSIASVVTTPPSGSPFPVGTTTVTSSATDVNGNTASCSFTVTVVIVNNPPVCAATPSISELWPPNHKFVDIQILGVTDPDGDSVTITITKITQDEPVNTVGDGNTTPDGAGIGTSIAQVRAERTGNRQVPGNGRVYRIWYSASDGRGGECTGSVAVCVPQNMGNARICFDDGQLYNSVTGAIESSASSSKAPDAFFGESTTVGQVLPKEYALYEAYPNPFNPSTSIQYDIPQGDYVKLRVYDITGREVATLVDEFQEAGHYVMRFNAQGLPSGVYLYHLSTGNFMQAKKLLLTK